MPIYIIYTSPPLPKGRGKFRLFSDATGNYRIYPESKVKNEKVVLMVLLLFCPELYVEVGNIVKRIGTKASHVILIISNRYDSVVARLDLSSRARRWPIDSHGARTL